MNTSEPLLSVVVTSRNDNHGGTLLRRMQTFLNGFIGQCKRHNLSAELIIVEWNPPADKPPLVEALHWPADLGPCVVRIIQVPAELHARFRHSVELPLFQMIAKNVGIRRARGKFALATNIDILFSDELMEFLASGQLEPGKMYRLDRHDVSTDVPVDASVDEQLEYCRTNLLRLNARNGTFRVTPEGRICPELDDVFDGEGFYLDEAWYPVDRWHHSGKASRWLGMETALTVRAPEGSKRALRLVVASGLPRGEAFDLEVRDDNDTIVASGRVDPGLRTIDLTLPVLPGETARYRFRTLNPVEPGPDGMVRALRLAYCGWAPVGTHESVPQIGGLNFADIAEAPVAGVAQDDNILLVRGWFPLHYWNGQPIYWAMPEASIVVTPRPGPVQPLRLVLEGGQAVGRSFQLEVRNETDEVVAAGRVESGRPFQLNLPHQGDRPAHFRLCLVDHVVPDEDGWVRAFRLISCGWARECVSEAIPQPGGLNFADVAEPPAAGVAQGGNILLGRGWCPLHYWDEQPLHWAAREASIVLTPRPGPVQPLRLVVEAGKAVRNRSFHLEVLDNGGEVVARGRVDSRRPFHLQLPGNPDRTAHYRLRLVNPIAPDADGWERAYRLISIGWTNPEENVLSNPGWQRFAVTLIGSQPTMATATLSSGTQQEPSNSVKLPLWYRAARRLVRPVRSFLRRLAQLHHPAPQTVAPSLPPATTATVSPAGHESERSLASRPVQPTSTSEPASADTTANPTQKTPEPTTSPARATLPANLHTNACGDFTLMALSDWFDLRANPEWEMYSLHIDSMMCHIAHNGGVVETILADPMRIYHIEHGAGSGWTPEGESLLMARMAARGIPVLSWPQVAKWCADMQELKCPMIFNGPDWGLAREALPETILSGATRRAAA